MAQPTKRPARKAVARKPKTHVVRVRRNSIDGKWYVERRTANGVLVARSKGYAKLARATEVAQDMAAPANGPVIIPA